MRRGKVYLRLDKLTINHIKKTWAQRDSVLGKPGALTWSLLHFLTSLQYIKNVRNVLNSVIPNMILKDFFYSSGIILEISVAAK